MSHWDELLNSMNEDVKERTDNFLGTFPTEESAKTFVASLRQALKSGAKFEGKLGTYRFGSMNVSIRARGPRDGNGYDTPKENGTRFDVYIKG